MSEGIAKFFAYKKSTGEILFSGTSCSPELLETAEIGINSGGIASLEDDFFDILNGVLAKKPARPGPEYVFDFGSKVWVDPRTLADVKAAKNTAINTSRAVKNHSTFTFSGKQIAVDQLSRGDIDAVHGVVTMTNALPPGWPGAWKAVDNTYVPIPDVAAWSNFYMSMVAQGNANFATAQALKAQVAAATTIAQVLAIPDWT